MKRPAIKIIPDALNPEPVEVIAASVLAIADGMKKVNATRLTREALVTLIHDHSKVSKGTIRIVLNNLDSLARTWLK